MNFLAGARHSDHGELNTINPSKLIDIKDLGQNWRLARPQPDERSAQKGQSRASMSNWEPGSPATLLERKDLAAKLTDSHEAAHA